MAVFDYIPQDIINLHFTHNALAFGIYPIYVSHTKTATKNQVMIAVRNGWPEWGLTLLCSLTQYYARLKRTKWNFKYKIQSIITVQVRA